MKTYLKPHIKMGENESYTYGQCIYNYIKGREQRRIYWHSGGTASIIFRDVEKQHLILVINNVRNLKADEIAEKIHALLE
jgi:hypothetical protein